MDYREREGQKGGGVMEIPSLSDSALKGIALDIFCNRIFTDWYLDPRDVTQVFRALLFFSKEQLDEFYFAKPGMIFEYLSEASPQMYNGLPVFFSHKILGYADAKKVWSIIQQLRAAADAITIGGKPDADPS